MFTKIKTKITDLSISSRFPNQRALVAVLLTSVLAVSLTIPTVKNLKSKYTNEVKTEKFIEENDTNKSVFIDEIAESSLVLSENVKVTATPTSTPKPTTVKSTPKVTSTPKPTATPQPPSSCPASTLNCVPCKAGEPYCRALPGQTDGFKGWSCQNNNPGNIRYSQLRIDVIKKMGGPAPCGEKASYMVFKTYNDGYSALKAYIKSINAGNHPSYPNCGNCTLKEFFSIYAPAGDQNDPNSYSAKVGQWIGVDPNTTTLNWVVANKLTDFVNAIQKMEGFFTY